jgi:hypothetical protein
MIQPSLYIIRDILCTLKSRDVKEIRKVCVKYADRFRNDKDLTSVCKIVLGGSDKVSEKDLGRMESLFQKLLGARRSEARKTSNCTATLYCSCSTHGSEKPKKAEAE